jgi:tRNA pseudouridine38-40 synthase
MDGFDIGASALLIGMRLALKIGYDGRMFYGHQRQPDRRTVEGECLAALGAAKIVPNVPGAFFRSASRTDRGVSALGNVIAFNTTLPSDAVVGAFNSKARDVWAWAVAEVSDSFHPRHAVERWYRYTLLDEIRSDELRVVGSMFVGTHNFRSFSTDPGPGLFTIDAVDVARSDGMTLIDVRARSFRRGMVRRIVAAMLAVVRGLSSMDEVREALAGGKRDFGSVAPEPLVLMDVRYDVPFRPVLKNQVQDEWARRRADLLLRLGFLEDLRRAAETPIDPREPVDTEGRDTRAAH